MKTGAVVISGTDGLSSGFPGSVMRTLSQIPPLLDELKHCIADDLEDQDLDFKEWPKRSMADGVKLVVDMAVCMANGGGGTVVFGVALGRVPGLRD